MKTIILTLSTIKGVTVGSIQVDGKFIIPQIDKLPIHDFQEPRLTDDEYRICCNLCELIQKETGK